MAGDVEVMRDQNDGNLLFFIQFFKESDDFATGLLIQIAGGFVTHQH